MRRRSFFPALALILAGPRTSAAQQLVWNEIKGPDGRYSLKLPPGYRHLHVPAHGGVLNSYAFMLPDKVTLELLDMTIPRAPNFPTTAEGLQTAIEQFEGGMQRSTPGATVVAQRPISLGAIAGREFILDVPGNRFQITRIYLAPTQMYIQVANGPASERGSALVQEFMDSFRLG
jgi:hypothetical protein